MGSIMVLVMTAVLLATNSVAAQPNHQGRAGLIATIGKRESQPKEAETDREPLDFSGTGRPGQQTAGESRGSCAIADEPLEAIIPTSNSGKTVKGHPDFWVYVPFSADRIGRAELILQNEARQDIWRSPITLDREPGYQSFSVPETQPPLKVDRWYRWYIKVYCNSQTASAQYVQGWVKRITMTSRLYIELQQNELPPHQTYGNYGIWYDAIGELLTLYKERPSDLALEQDWQNIIEAQGVDLESLPNVRSTYEAIKN